MLPVNAAERVFAMKKMVLHWLLLALVFYLLPLAMRDTGTAMVVLLVAMPLACLGVGLAFGMKNKNVLAFSGVAALLFVPTVFIYYNSSALVYALAFGVMVLAGCTIGRLIAWAAAK